MTQHDTTGYARDGFCVLSQVLNPDQISAVHAEAKAVFDVQLKRSGMSAAPVIDDREFEQRVFELFKSDYDAFLGCAKAAQHILSLHRLSLEPAIIDLLKQIGLEFPVICVKPILYFNSRHLAKIEGHYKTPAHQDWRSMQGSLNSVVIWIPLIDIDQELGAVEFLPGSHRSGLLPTEKDDWFEHVQDGQIDENRFVPAEVKRGDMVVFSAFTVHRSGNNVTDRIRWSTHMRYNDLHEQTFQQRNFVHPYRVYHPHHEIQHPGFPSEAELRKVFP